MNTKTSKRDVLKEKRKEEILDAALEEFVRSGFTATRVEDIAARVGVTKGTVYFHFESKDKLFEAMVHHVASNRPGIMEKAAAIRSDDPVEDLRAVIRLIYADIVCNPTYQAIFRLVIAEAGRFPSLQAFFRSAFGEPMTRAMIRDVYERGVASGHFRQFDLTMLADIVFGPPLLKLVSFILDPETDLDAYVDVHCDIVVNGIRS